MYKKLFLLLFFLFLFFTLMVNSLYADEIKATYPEGPLIVSKDLYYVEYSLHQVVRLKNAFQDDSKREKKIFWKEEGCGPSSVITYGGNHFLVACYNSHQVVELNESGVVVNRLKNIVGPNDFVADKKGGVYFTASGRDFSFEAPIEGKVYYLDAHFKEKLLWKDIHYANGIALMNEGKTLIVAEHLKNRLLSFSIQEDGELRETGVFANLPYPEGATEKLIGPDGIESTFFDGEEVLFVCQYGGGQILQFDKEGKLLRREKVPGTYVTNLTYHQTMKKMIVTYSHDTEKVGGGAVILNKIW